MYTHRVGVCVCLSLLRLEFCEDCQRKKLKRVKSRHPMMITPMDAFEKIFMDIYDPGEKSRRGHTYILTVQDCLTKYCVAIPLMRQTAKEVTTALVIHVFCRLGAPMVILSDQGINFLSNLIKEVCRLFRIRRCKTSAFHPQSNEALERSHHDLTTFLKVMISDGDNWDELIDRAMLSYSATIHESTGYAPHELVYAMKQRIPSAHRLLSAHSPHNRGTLICRASKRTGERIKKETRAH